MGYSRLLSRLIDDDDDRDLNLPEWIPREIYETCKSYAATRGVLNLSACSVSLSRSASLVLSLSVSVYLFLSLSLSFPSSSPVLQLPLHRDVVVGRATGMLACASSSQFVGGDARGLYLRPPLAILHHQRATSSTTTVVEADSHQLRVG